jgi:GNAT superfamily N-acetyltransferase
MAKEIYIRHLQQTDGAAIAALSIQLGYRVKEDVLQQQIDAIIAHPEHQVFVAMKANEIVGYIHGFKGLRLTTEPFFEIGALVVAEQERQIGIGKMLVEHVERNALRCSKVRVRCNRLRIGAHQFYQNLSYLERKEQKVFEKTLT